MVKRNILVLCTVSCILVTFKELKSQELDRYAIFGADADVDNIYDISPIYL